MNARIIKTVINIAIVAITLQAITAVTASAAVVSTSTTAPTVDATDESNLGEQTGTLKWFTAPENEAGQTFTPSENLQLNAFTVRLGQKNDADANPERLNFRLGTITRPDGVFTFTDIYSEATEWTMDWAAGDYVTFTLNEAQELTGGVEYGVILDAQAMGDWHVGIPYLSETGNTYAGGNSIGRGGQRNKDLVFHADLIPSLVDPELPTIDAGSNWVTWSGAPVALDDSFVINNSTSAVVIDWSSDAVGGVIVDYSATNVEAPVITITKPQGDPVTVTFTLAGNYQGSTSDDVVDTMTIDVYDTACLAAGAFGEVVLDASDINEDCVTNILDLYEMAAKWLNSYALDAPAVK